MRRVAWLPMQYFSTLSQKRHDFREKKVPLEFPKILSTTFCFLKKIQQDVIKMYVGLHVKYTLFLSDFNET